MPAISLLHLCYNQAHIHIQLSSLATLSSK